MAPDPAELSSLNVYAIKNPQERLVASTLRSVGLDVYRAIPFELPPHEKPVCIGKIRQRMTIPDLILKDSNELRIVEVSKGRPKKSPRKKCQKAIMERLGLGKQYIQLGGRDLQELSRAATDLALINIICQLFRL